MLCLLPHGSEALIIGSRGITLSVRNQSFDPYHINRSPGFHHLKSQELSGSQDLKPFPNNSGKKTCLPQKKNISNIPPAKQPTPKLVLCKSKSLKNNVSPAKTTTSRPWPMRSWMSSRQNRGWWLVGWYVFFQRSRCKDKTQSRRFVCLPWLEKKWK